MHKAGYIEDKGLRRLKELVHVQREGVGARFKRAPVAPTIFHTKPRAHEEKASRMKLVRYSKAEEFCARIWPLLIAREAENNLLIGIIGQLAKGASAESVGGTGRPGFWTVEEEGRVVAAAAITPPQRLLLTQMTAPAIEAVVSGLRREGLSLPGVVAPSETAEQFAEQWNRLGGQTFHLGHAMRIYQLKKVIHPGDALGRMATAEMGDFDLLREWNEKQNRFVHNWEI